jgi:hypothetical protein
MDSGNQRREPDIKASRAFGTLYSPLNFGAGWVGTLGPGPHGATNLYRQVGRQQHEQSAVTGLLIKWAASSKKPAEIGVDTDILYSKNQREAMLSEKTNSRTGQRALAETTTREFEDVRFHLVSNSVFTT